jgi:hydrophobe/amphiphile efflux-3 (HAE3) family protein
MGTSVRRPRLVAGLVALLALLGGVAALRLDPQTTADTLSDADSAAFEASARHHEAFGDDAIYVLVRRPVARLVLTEDLLKTIGLEGCLAGAAPAGSPLPGGPRGPCGALARSRAVKVVYGPGTFVNESVGRIQDEVARQSAAAQERAERAAGAARGLARRRGYSRPRADRVAAQARELVRAEYLRDVAQLALRYGITSIPRVDDPAFVSTLVFDARKPAGTPKERFSYLFPSRDAALIQVRLRPDLTPAERQEAIATIRRAVAMPQWRLPSGPGTYLVTGAPVVVDDLTDALSASIAVLLAAALVVMALTLLAVFRARLRLLPLLVALCATAITFGLLWASGQPLTMASVAVLPILIGLAVDYAVQLQSRLEEERRRGRGLRAAVEHVAGDGGPTLLTAMAASAAGFLVLLLSPVPMVRGFGVLLAVGVGVALACALTLGSAALALGDRGARGRRAARPAALLAASVRGAGDLLAVHRPARAVRAATRRAGRIVLQLASRRPGRILAVAGALALVGWVLDTRAPVQSDIQRLVPQDLASLRDLATLQQATGVGGEVDLLVRSDRLTDPEVVAWMGDYQARVLKAAGYTSARGCGRADLCPALSLPDLFGNSAGASRREVEDLLDAVPPYFAQGVVTRDRRTASVAFGIRLMSVERQGEVIEAMRRELDPPPGVRADLAGLPVLTADANARVSSPARRAGLLLAGLAAVALVLLVAFRSPKRALVPLVPIVLASGWSGLVLFALGIELNPLSVTLGALVVAISTEFSVLLSERFRRERAAGLDPAAALAVTYGSTGTAVVASGITALAGFAVLGVSDIRMLRDFGAVTVVDLGVSLLGVLVVLPAVLLLAERGRGHGAGGSRGGAGRGRRAGSGTGEDPGAAAPPAEPASPVPA